MNKAQIKTEIEELKARIAMLEGKVDEPESGIWVPEKKERYWRIDSYGFVYPYIWYGEKGNYFSLYQNNVFKTEQEAKDHKRRLDIEGIMRKHAKGFKPDWNNGSQAKHFIGWDFLENKVYLDFNIYIRRQSEIYFATKEDRQAAIDEIGMDNLRWYFMGQ